ncbi:hypothetical protein AKJ16_DCAP10500 [Drosera capensis]
MTTSHLLLSFIFIEILVIILLLFDCSFRNHTVLGLDRSAALEAIQSPAPSPSLRDPVDDDGDDAVSVADQLSLVRCLLVASLTATEAAKKQSRSFKDKRSAISDEFKAMREEITISNSKVKHLKSKFSAKENQAKIAEVKLEAMKKQSEVLLLHYDKALEDNRNLKNQLQDISKGLSFSELEIGRDTNTYLLLS